MGLKLSIITINYNNAEWLQQTFDSVRTQTLKEIDYVVIDGGSTDGSKEIIEKNSDIISYWCSEKDKGIYDAQNKGILKSKGDYLLFLNAGDVFAGKYFLQRALDFIEQYPEKSFIYANTILKNKDESLYHIEQPEELDMFFFYTKTLNHQSCLIKRDLFDKYGLYDTNYRICSDFDFILKVFIADSKLFKHYNTFAVIYENNGFSADPKNYDIVVGERLKIINSRFTPQQISDCIKQEKKMNSWQENTKRSLYANKFTYGIIKAYVKIKESIWKK